MPRQVQKSLMGIRANGQNGVQEKIQELQKRGGRGENGFLSVRNRALGDPPPIIWGGCVWGPTFHMGQFRWLSE